MSHQLARFLLLTVVTAFAPVCAATDPRPPLAIDAEREAITLAEDAKAAAGELWRLAETALQETASSRLLAERLRAEGFAIEPKPAGLETAFVASYGRGRPVIGILAEYDALPGLGNEIAPVRTPRHDGVTAGHGCGHNLIGAGSVYGAIALKRALVRSGLPGTIKVYGTPAEETLIGKSFMARAGAFADLDVCLDWHPGGRTSVRNTQNLALNSFTVAFQGRTAHAGAAPWSARSALDAVELMNHAANMLREHMPPEARINYIITDGGTVPNVVPDRAEAWYFVRAPDRELVDDLYQRLLDAAAGAALMTGTRHEVRLIAGVHPLSFNRPLQQALQRHLESVGPPSFNTDDDRFGREMQATLGLPALGFGTEVQPLGEVAPGGTSTDVGDVSQIVPTVGFNVAMCPLGVPGHTWALTACAGAESGLASAAYAARIIASFGGELLVAPDLLVAAQSDHLRATGGRPFRSAIPPEQLPPAEPGR